MLGQVDCVLEDHGFHMLEPVEARGLDIGVQLVYLLVPLLGAKQKVRHFCPQIYKPRSLRLWA